MFPDPLRPGSPRMSEPVVKALPSSLQEALERAAHDHASQGIAILDTRGRSEEFRGFDQLHAAALRRAAVLVNLGLRPREPVLICLPTSFEFLESWFGALLAGAWPVAVAPPGGFGSSAWQLARLSELLDHLDTDRLICSATVVEEAREAGLEHMAAAALTPERLAGEAPLAAFRAARPGPQETAFLQLTSGSTGRPRAVVIPHRAALSNARAILRAVSQPFGGPETRPFDKVVCWLPLHHDMGLVGCLLTSIVMGLDLTLLSTRTFLGRPRTWLEQLARGGRTISPAPNFAYQTCFERVAPALFEGLGLEDWRTALVGAEMVRPATLRAFADSFARAGFKPTSFSPCYGLAEATLAVTMDTRGEGCRTRRVETRGELDLEEVACVGAPVEEIRVEVRALDGSQLAEGQIGEVCVSGPGVFAGYHRDPEASAECMREGWLCTGDLGTLLDGELYITGRIKDLIIVRGQNLMPHELEWLADGATGGGGLARSAAFAVVDREQGELPVLVVEIEDPGVLDLSRLEREIRLRVAHALGIPLADLCFVRRGGLPKTTSGKLRRSEIARCYRAGELARLHPERAGSMAP